MLAAGEFGWESDTRTFKVGNGTTAWNSLSYSAGGAPSGSAGGALDGTYPNPGIAASVAGDGLAETSNVLSVNVDGSTIETSSDALRVKDAGITEAKLGLADNTTNNVSTTKHGLTPKAPNDATKFLDGTGAWDTVKDSDLSTSDITTNDVTTSKHGFTPKAPNDTAKFLRGDGTWAAVGGVTTVIATDVFWDAKGDLAAGTGSDAASRVPVGTDYDSLRALASATPGVAWQPGAPVLLYDYEVSGSDKASIDTGVDTPQAGIAGTSAFPALRILEVWMMLQGDNAATVDVGVDLTLNNDTGANYDNQALSAVNTSVAGAGAIAQASWAFNTKGQGGSTSYPSVHRLTIPAYASTVFFKIAETETGRIDTTAANQRADIRALGWRSTAAITRLKIAARTTTKLKIGSRFMVYAR